MIFKKNLIKTVQLGSHDSNKLYLEKFLSNILFYNIVYKTK